MPIILKQPADTGDATANRILDFISINESRGNYNSRFGDKKLRLKDDLSEYTIGELLAAQQASRVAGAKSTAVGKYQFIYKTLKALAAKLGTHPSVKFTPEMQDTFAYELLRQRGYETWRAGGITNNTFALSLAKEWASLPHPDTGRSVYAGDGLNASHVSIKQVYKALEG